MRNKKGFTLVEILIVVVILGILAAIVIPQFTDASTQSKVSSCQTTLTTLRSQIELYKIQHNDVPPAFATFKTQMETYSDATGTTGPAKTATLVYGPYIQMVPINPWNNSYTIGAGDVLGVGWVYDDSTGDIHIGVADLALTNADLALELQTEGFAL